MNIKSLLIGSAAALVAVSGARAADAVMAEPEPVEYVKVCDAYGAGFFYIPGTETCLQISGLVWFQVGATSDNDGFDGHSGSYHFFAPDQFNTSVNVRVNVDARSETEYGTLRSFVRFQGGGNGYSPRDDAYGTAQGYGTDLGLTFDQAYLQLGGFTMGYTESLYEGAIGPYGMSYSGYGSSSWDGLYYGYTQRDLVSYVYKSGTGLFAGLSLEDDGGDGEGYAPDVVGLLAYEQAWGGVFVTAGYDESADGFGVKVGGQYNFSGGAWWVRAVGSYADSYNDYGVEHPGEFSNVNNAFNGNGFYGNAEYTGLLELGHKFTDKLTVSVAGQYFGNEYVGGLGSDDKENIDAYAVELNAVYTPVTNFEIRTEIVYQDVQDHDNLGGLDGTVSGFVRFTRYF